jgi:hypothetical protein
MKSGFQLPLRSKIRDALKHPDFRYLHGYWNAYYARPSDLHIYRGTEHAAIQSQRGSKQGCAWGSFLFALVLQPILIEMATKFPDVDIMAYVDDITLVSTDPCALATAVVWLNSRLQRELQSELNFGKCQWYSRTHALPEELQPVLAPDKRVVREGLKVVDMLTVLGVRLGPDELVKQALLAEVESHQLMFDRIRCLPIHAQLAMMQQTAIPKMNHIIRCHPPELTLAACEIFDRMVVTAWSETGRVLPNDRTKRIAALPHQFGGAGFTRMSAIASHAYSASLESCSAAGVNSKPLSQRQRCNEMYAKEKQTFLGDPGTAAHLEECSGKGTGTWLKQPTGVDSWIPDDCASAGLRLRLNQPHRDWQTGDRCPGCGADLDSGFVVQHLRGCTRIRGHNASAAAADIQRTLGQICNAASVQHETTQPRDCQIKLCSGCSEYVPVAQVADHCLTRGCDAAALGRARVCGPDKRMFFNDAVVVVDTTSIGPATVSNCALGLNKCFELRAQTKDALYRSSIEARNEEFVVMSMTPNGAMCEGTKHVLKKIAGASSGVLSKTDAELMLRRGNVIAQGRALVNAERAAGIADTDFQANREAFFALHSDRVKAVRRELEDARQSAPKTTVRPVADNRRRPKIPPPPAQTPPTVVVAETPTPLFQAAGASPKEMPTMLHQAQRTAPRSKLHQSRVEQRYATVASAAAAFECAANLADRAKSCVPALRSVGATMSMIGWGAQQLVDLSDNAVRATSWCAHDRSRHNNITTPPIAPVWRATPEAQLYGDAHSPTTPRRHGTDAPQDSAPTQASPPRLRPQTAQRRQQQQQQQQQQRQQQQTEVNDRLTQASSDHARPTTTTCGTPDGAGEQLEFDSVDCGASPVAHGTLPSPPPTLAHPRHINTVYGTPERAGRRQLDLNSVAKSSEDECDDSSVVSPSPTPARAQHSNTVCGTPERAGAQHTAAVNLAARFGATVTAPECLTECATARTTTTSAAAATAAATTTATAIHTTAATAAIGGRMPTPEAHSETTTRRHQPRAGEPSRQEPKADAPPMTPASPATTTSSGVSEKPAWRRGLPLRRQLTRLYQGITCEHRHERARSSIRQHGFAAGVLVTCVWASLMSRAYHAGPWWLQLSFRVTLAQLKWVAQIGFACCGVRIAAPMTLEMYYVPDRATTSLRHEFQYVTSYCVRIGLLVVVPLLWVLMVLSLVFSKIGIDDDVWFDLARELLASTPWHLAPWTLFVVSCWIARAVHSRSATLALWCACLVLTACFVAWTMTDVLLWTQEQLLRIHEVAKRIRISDLVVMCLPSSALAVVWAVLGGLHTPPRVRKLLLVPLMAWTLFATLTVCEDYYTTVTDTATNSTTVSGALLPGLTHPLDMIQEYVGLVTNGSLCLSIVLHTAYHVVWCRNDGTSGSRRKTSRKEYRIGLSWEGKLLAGFGCAGLLVGFSAMCNNAIAVDAGGNPFSYAAQVINPVGAVAGTEKSPTFGRALCEVDALAWRALRHVIYDKDGLRQLSSFAAVHLIVACVVPSVMAAIRARRSLTLVRWLMETDATAAEHDEVLLVDAEGTPPRRWEEKRLIAARNSVTSAPPPRQPQQLLAIGPPPAALPPQRPLPPAPITGSSAALQLLTGLALQSPVAPSQQPPAAPTQHSTFTCGVLTATTKRPCKQQVPREGDRCKCHSLSAAPQRLAMNAEGRVPVEDAGNRHSPVDVDAGGSNNNNNNKETKKKKKATKGHSSSSTSSSSSSSDSNDDDGGSRAAVAARQRRKPAKSTVVVTKAVARGRRGGAGV